MPSRLVIIAAALILVAVTADVSRHGLLTHLDHRIADRMFSWDLRHKDWPRRLLTVGLYFGQRGVVLTGATLLAAVTAWRARTSEPVIRLVVALAGIVVVIYGFKYGLPRNSPGQDAAHVSGGTGQSYPSGHITNAVVLWGLAQWTLARFWPSNHRLVRLVTVLRWIAPFAVAVTMTLLNYHYLTDFVGGAAAAVLLLALTLSGVWTSLALRLDRRVWQSERR